MGFGRSLELFFVDGRPDGMLTAKVFNWTGQILRAPRTLLKATLQRPEAEYTGVYVLLGEKDGAALAYIGEGEDVGARIRDHEAKKDWWTTVVLITTAADELNKAHVKFLESRLVEVARAAKVSPLENGNTPPRPSLSEANIANMEEFLDTLLMALPAIGISIFASAKRPDVDMGTGAKPQPKEFILTAPKYGVRAKSVVDDGEFIVLKDSLAQGKWIGQGSSGSGYAALHAELLLKGVLTPIGDLAKFSVNYAFSSPSAAAAIVLGRSANGRTEWLLESDGRSFKVWEEQEILSSST